MKLKAVYNTKGELYGYAHWCHGCSQAHVFYVAIPGQPESRPCWTFDGNTERPTFNPSMREFVPAKKDAAGNVLRPEVTLCHYFLKDGVIDYLADSTYHHMRGKQPLQDIPDHWNV